MAIIHSSSEDDLKNQNRFNSELVVAFAFNLGAWLVVGVIAWLVIT